MTRLDDLPGVGPQLAQRLRDHFGSEDSFFQAAHAQDVAAVTAVTGVSGRRAVRLIQEANGTMSAQGLLATDAAERLHEDLLERIQAHAVMDAGKHRIALLAPHATPEAALASAQAVLTWRDRVAAWDREAIRDALSRIRPAPAPRPRRDIGTIAIADEPTRKRLESAGLDKWLEIAGPGAARHAAGHRLVLNLHPELDLSNLPQAVDLPQKAPQHQIAPDMVLQWFEGNRQTLQALADVAAATGRPSRAPEAIAVLAAAGPPVQDSRDLSVEAEELRAWADAELRVRVGSLQLSGDELLEAFGKGLPARLRDARDDVVTEANVRFRQQTGLRIDPLVAEHPIHVDEDVLREAAATADAKRAVLWYEARAKAAQALHGLRPEIEAEIQAAQRLDADVALGTFALELDLQAPRFSDTLRFRQGMHLDLPRDGTSQPVDYHLDGHPVALLTGANSGGKTTLLELVGQTVWMARLGLPVPAVDAEVPWIDELHYVTTRKAMDAGAFESFLRRFLPVAAPGPRRLVLADEVEAMTELGAAASILGFFLQRLVQGGHLGIVVTHLAPQIIATGLEGVRVDGIQARGLDEDGHLVVDRTPRIGELAASTPQLIIQRLARQSGEEHKELWNALLAAVQGHPEPVVVPAT